MPHAEDLINSSVLCKREITRSRPRTAMISKIPGLTVFPVRATLTGWAIFPSFKPVVSMTAVKAASRLFSAKSVNFHSSATSDSSDGSADEFKNFLAAASSYGKSS